jgi:hypothetical protein
MRTQQLVWNDRAGWTAGNASVDDASLVLYFGTRAALACGARYDELRGMFPTAHILGCSTGGQINNNDINDDEIVAAAIGFDATALRLCRQDISGTQQSRACGEDIGRALDAADLAGVFVLSDGRAARSMIFAGDVPQGWTAQLMRGNFDRLAAGAADAARQARVGFYSYGEISPHANTGLCELHNQTMTVTTLAEVGG